MIATALCQGSDGLMLRCKSGSGWLPLTQPGVGEPLSPPIALHAIQAPFGHRLPQVATAPQCHSAPVDLQGEREAEAAAAAEKERRAAVAAAKEEEERREAASQAAATKAEAERNAASISPVVASSSTSPGWFAKSPPSTHSRHNKPSPKSPAAVEKIYRCLFGAPGVAYRNSPDFSDKAPHPGPQSPECVIGVEVQQGFLRCKSGLGWLPLTSPDGKTNIFEETAPVPRASPAASASSRAQRAADSKAQALPATATRSASSHREREPSSLQASEWSGHNDGAQASRDGSRAAEGRGVAAPVEEIKSRSKETSTVKPPRGEVLDWGDIDLAVEQTSRVSPKKDKGSLCCRADRGAELAFDEGVGVEFVEVIALANQTD